MGETLAEIVQEFIDRQGGVRNAASITGIDAGYLSRLASGKKRNPSEEVLNMLGIRRIVAYVKEPK